MKPTKRILSVGFLLVVYAVWLCSCNNSIFVTQEKRLEKTYAENQTRVVTTNKSTESTADYSEKTYQTTNNETTTDIEQEETNTYGDIETPDYSHMSIVSVSSGEGGGAGITGERSVSEPFYDENQPKTLDRMVGEYHFVGKYYESKYWYYGTRQYNYYMGELSNLTIDNNGNIISFMDANQSRGSDRNNDLYNDEEYLEIAKDFLEQYVDDIEDYSVEERPRNLSRYNVLFTKCFEGYKTSEEAYIAVNEKGEVFHYKFSMLNEIDIHMKLPFDMKDIERQVITYLDGEVICLRDLQAEYSADEDLKHAWEIGRPQYEYDFTIVKLNEKRFIVECDANIVLADDAGKPITSVGAYWFTLAPQ